MTPYRRKIQYYETDRMGVAHHSRYILWMEEARIDLLERLGFSYAELEDGGTASPVRNISCDYRRTAGFGDELEIYVNVADISGASFELYYEMKDAADGETVFTGTSKHVFTDRTGRIVRLKREMPELYAALAALLSEKRA